MSSINALGTHYVLRMPGGQEDANQIMKILGCVNEEPIEFVDGKSSLAPGTLFIHSVQVRENFSIEIGVIHNPAGFALKVFDGSGVKQYRRYPYIDVSLWLVGAVFVAPEN